MKQKYVFLICLLIVILIATTFINLVYVNKEGNENMEPNIVLTCINNFQDYILINIKQLIRLGHKNIFVITNGKFFENFDAFKNDIVLVDCDKLPKTFEKVDKDSTDFWHLTSSRFMYIYEFMKRDNINNVFHMENDVLIYYNYKTIMNSLDDNLYIPFDTFHRNIASLVYIPNEKIYKEILNNYDFSKNDMDNFASIKEKTGLIQQFPIFHNSVNINDVDKDEYKFVTTNFDKFNYVFDAAAIGQYLGGVDPKNAAGDTTGFVNEKCIIKYDKYKFEWKIIEGIKKPFIIIDGESYPIFNLHIHSKTLEKFV
jgi:hypothetical protein